MSRTYWSSDLYPLFLKTVSSCTYVSFTDAELENELSGLARRAIARFKFPKVSLEYEFDPELDAEGMVKGYYFVEEPRMLEMNVILAWMKVYWLEFQLSKERNYENVYADKNVTAFSSGNLISSMEKAYSTLRDEARKCEEDYGRISLDGKPAIGNINV